MATEQQNRSQDSISYDGPGGLLIADWRSKIAPGEVVDSGPLNQMVNVINAWDDHTHTYTDYSQRRTFGDTGSDVSSSNTTSKHDQDNTSVGAINAGDLITAAKHNAMAGVCNDLRSHHHTITDTTS
jgi:hypothetical protein